MLRPGGAADLEVCTLLADGSSVLPFRHNQAHVRVVATSQRCGKDVLLASLCTGVFFACGILRDDCRALEQCTAHSDTRARARAHTQHTTRICCRDHSNLG